MKILITGATGFIGRHVVAEALARGHEVVALSRSVQTGGVPVSPRVRWLWHDLASSNELMVDWIGIDTVVHLAAALAGTANEQYRATVLATRHLLAAMRRAGIRKLVGISSIAVLDYPRMSALSLIDEDTALADGSGMGTYARMKLEQETLFADFLAETGALGAILRPGLVYDESRLFAAHAGVFKGAVRLRVSHRGEVPVIEVGGLARAIVNAAERDLSGGAVVQLVDDNLPALPEYMTALRRRGVLPSTGIPVPWLVMAAGAFALRTALGVVGQRNRVPEAFLQHGFAARLKPFRYSNSKARELLAWVPGTRFS